MMNLWKILKKILIRSLKKINDDLVEKSKDAWEDFHETKKDVLNNIKERHAALDKEIEKMEETTKDLEKVVEVLQETKATLEEVVENKETESTEKSNHEKNQEILAETEKKLDELLDDLNK